MIRRALLLILLCAAPLLAVNLRRFQIEDIANPAKAEDNELAINLNFDDLWLAKQDVNTQFNPGTQQYLIKDLADPKQLEFNIHAMKINFDDLYAFKLQFSSPARTMESFISDIDDPAKSEENSQIINFIFDDLWNTLVDK